MILLWVVGNPNFSGQFKKIIRRFIGVGYGLGVMRPSACLVVGQVMVCGCGFLFGCVMVYTEQNS